MCGVEEHVTDVVELYKYEVQSLQRDRSRRGVTPEEEAQRVARLDRLWTAMARDDRSRVEVWLAGGAT